MMLWLLVLVGAGSCIMQCLRAWQNLYGQYIEAELALMSDFPRCLAAYLPALNTKHDSDVQLPGLKH